MTTQKVCMLIDDDPDDHEIFSLALEDSELPVRIVSAYDGVEALARLESNSGRPDYIFLDLNLPGMSGKECLRELKSNDRLRDIPVVIYSTSSEIRDLVDAQQLGAVAFIVKSPDITDLTLALDDFFTTET